MGSRSTEAWILEFTNFLGGFPDAGRIEACIPELTNAFWKDFQIPRALKRGFLCLRTLFGRILRSGEHWRVDSWPYEDRLEGFPDPRCIEAWNPELTNAFKEDFQIPGFLRFQTLSRRTS